MTPPISRRPFIKTTIGATLATSLASVQAEQPKKKKLGWAIVGLGWLSKNKFAPALLESEHAKLAAIVTGNPNKAKEWCEKFDLEDKDVFNYDNFDKIVNHPGVDVVCIVLPNNLHHDFAIRAAKAGKHVFCEKPMAITSKDCREMIAACDEAKVKLGIAYRNRFEPHHVESMRFSQEKIFGEVRHIDAGFGFRIGNPNQWRMKKEFGGGALLDVGVYAIQAARYLTGEEPSFVTARETKTDPKKFAEVDETIQFMLQFPSGKTANLITSFNFNGYNQFTVFADNGRFGMKNAYGYAGQTGWTSNKEIPLNFPAENTFISQIDLFSQSIIENTPFEVDGVDGLRDILICEAILKSIKEKTPVEVEKA